MNLFLLFLITANLTEADKKFAWKRVKPNIHKRLTMFGVIDVCGVARGVEPLYPGEQRHHNCDLLHCRKTVDGLEKWACEDCVTGTPSCIEYQNRRLRRNLSKRQQRAEARSRKEKYRRMKRATILAERKIARQKKLAEKAKKEAEKSKKGAEKEARKLAKKSRKEAKLAKMARRRNRHEKKARKSRKPSI